MREQEIEAQEAERNAQEAEKLRRYELRECKI